MCDIGKPIEIIDVEPLSLPAPLPRHDEPEPSVPVIIPVPVIVPVMEPTFASKV